MKVSAKPARYAAARRERKRNEEMKRTIGVMLGCAVMSLPFAYLLWWNLTPGTPPYGRTVADPSLKTVDIVFYIQHILSIIALFLLFVKNMDDVPGYVKTGGVIGLLSLIGSFALTWKDEIVNVTLKDTNSFARFAHPNLPAWLFYGFLTAIWAGVMFGTAAFLMGLVSDGE